MQKYKKGNITLQIRVPIKMAISILGRLYGCGVLTREQYLKKLKNVSEKKVEEEKNRMKKMDKILNQVLKRTKRTT